MQRLAFAADQLRSQPVPIDRVVDRLTYFQVLHRRIGAGGAARVENQKADAHGRTAGDHQIGHGLEVFRLIRRHPPGPVDATGHQLGQTRFGIGDHPKVDVPDLWLTLRAVLEVVRVLVHFHAFAGGDGRYLVRPGADRFTAEACQPDFFEIFFRKHRYGVGEVFQRRREGLFQVQTNTVIAQFFGALDPVDVLDGDHLGLGRHHIIEGEHHVICSERVAVVKLHALAQLEVDGRIVDLFPAGGEHRLVLAIVRVAIDQVVPDQATEDHAFAQVVVIGADVFRFAVGGVDQCVVSLAGQDGETAEQAQ
ncbi:Unknown protein sequence [Pseudomonas syringae pv. aceris]|uniref:Uncharacterized protein n=1 Tax=Pseudomonas syringae pv. aceris TaxID=199198 RepID=A0A0P9IG81_PSESX|nr:Unknown protein sequence [Pseudomonas syringae pv. aceris]